MYDLVFDNIESREFGPRVMNLLTVENSQKSLGIFDVIIEKVSKQRENIGLTQNRLEHTMDLNNNFSGNL